MLLLNGLSKWHAGPYPCYINLRQQFLSLYYKKITENREPCNIRHCQIPVIAEISIDSSTVLLYALVVFYIVMYWSTLYVNTQCIYLKKRVTYITTVKCSHLNDESEQVKQLSKSSINRLWSLSIIQSQRQT